MAVDIQESILLGSVYNSIIWTTEKIFIAEIYII